MAYYPVYRIPDAPLTARFLTFHPIDPQPLAQPGLPPPPDGADPPQHFFLPVRGGGCIRSAPCCRRRPVAESQLSLLPLRRCGPSDLSATAAAGQAPQRAHLLPPTLFVLTHVRMLVRLAGLMWDNLQNEKWFDRIPGRGGGGFGIAPEEEALPRKGLEPWLRDWEVRTSCSSVAVCQKQAVL